MSVSGEDPCRPDPIHTYISTVYSLIQGSGIDLRNGTPDFMLHSYCSTYHHHHHDADYEPEVYPMQAALTWTSEIYPSTDLDIANHYMVLRSAITSEPRRLD